MPSPTALRFVPPSPRQRVCTLAITLALLLAPRFALADDKAPPAKTGSTTGSSSSGNSVTNGFRSLGQQISDPKTLDRIKGHEQEFEKNVQSSRDQQRKAHPGELRAGDATGMANDPKMGGQGKTKSATKAAAPKGTKVTNEGSGAAPPAAKAPPKAPPPAAAPAK